MSKTPESAEVEALRQRVAALERALAERERRFDELRTQQLVDNLQVGVLIQDVHAEILLANQKALDLLGLTREQLLGKTSFDPDWNVIHEDGSPFPGETHPVPQALASGTGVHNVVMGVYRPLTRDRVWLLVDAQPQFTENGTITEVVCTFTDITDRVHVEEARRIAEEKWRSLVENSPDHILIVNREGIIEFVNRTLTHAALDDVIGKSLYALTPPDRREATRQALEGMFTAGISATYEDGVNLGGKFLSLSTRMVPIRKGDEIVSAMLISTDITERKQVEAALRANETQMRAILQVIPDLLLLIDENGTYLDVQTTREDLLYVQARALVGRRIPVVLPQDTAQRFMEAIHQAITTNTLQRMEYKLETVSGTRWFDSRIVRLGTLINDKEVVVWVARDITERIRAEEALGSERNLLRTLLDSLPDAVYIKDTRNRFILANPPAAYHLGVKSPQNLIGKTDFDFFAYEDARKGYLNEQQLFETGEPVFNLEVYDINRTTGNGTWMLVTKVPLRDENGQIVGMIGINRDITERKRAEDIASQNEARFHAIVASAPGVIYRFVARGDEWRVEYVSPRVSSIFGIEAEVFIRDIQTFIGRIHPDDLPSFTQSVREVIALKGAWNYEGRFIKPAGEIIWWQGISTVSALVSDEIAFDGVLFDITERKRADEERERLIEELRTATHLAKESARLKSEFLSIMSHELRTPLNAIEGFTSIMLAGMGVSLEPKARSMVERISANSKRLLALMNDFLDLSKIEAGRLQLVSTPISPRTLMEQWMLEVSELAEKKGLTFETMVDPDVPEMIYGDEEAITKIATNLMYNAIKFTERGGVTVQMWRQSSWLVIEVHDTGIGIPPHAQEFIFDEFRQIDSSSRRIHGGAGLGLAIVRRLCHFMEGTVQVSSVVGEGSTFTVKLPLKTTLLTERGA